MIDIVVRSFIGQLGGKILDFYLEYSLIINGIILLYFLLAVLGRRNYRHILNYAILFLKNDHSRIFTKKDPKSVARVLKNIEIPWHEFLKTSSFPFLTPPGSFRLYLKNTKNIKKLFSNEVLATTIVETGE